MDRSTRGCADRQQSDQVCPTFEARALNAVTRGSHVSPTDCARIFNGVLSLHRGRLASFGY